MPPQLVNALLEAAGRSDSPERAQVQAFVFECVGDGKAGESRIALDDEEAM